MNSLKRALLLIVPGSLLALILLFVIGASGPRLPINNGLLQSDLDGNGFCILNLSCIEGTNGDFQNIFTSNLFSQTIYVSNLFATNISVINEYVTNLTVQNITIQSNIFYQDTNPGVALFGSYVLPPSSLSSPSNGYLIDFGRTNNQGQFLIYADLTPTNDVFIAGITNCQLDRLMSIDILATANRTVYFRTNLFVATNGTMLVMTNDGVTVLNTMYALPMFAGQLLRFDIRSNRNSLEPQWELKP